VCIRKSLGTSDRQQAELKGSAERTHLLALFNAARQASSKPIQELAVRSPVVQGIDFSLGTDLRPQAVSAPQSHHRKQKTPSPRTQTKKVSPSLRQLYERWLQIKKRTKGTENSCLLAVQACEKALGVLSIDKFTRAHGDSFRSWLLKQAISSRTARMYLVWVKTLLRYAYRDLELMVIPPQFQRTEK